MLFFASFVVAQVVLTPITANDLTSTLKAKVDLEGRFIDENPSNYTLATTHPDSEDLSATTSESTGSRAKRQDVSPGEEDFTFSTATDDSDSVVSIANADIPPTDFITTTSTTTTRPTTITSRPPVTTKPTIKPVVPTTKPTVRPGITTKSILTTKPMTIKPAAITTKPGVSTKPIGAVTMKSGFIPTGKTVMLPNVNAFPITTQKIGASIYFPSRL